MEQGIQADTIGVLALASCQYPPDLLHEQMAYRSMERMAEALRHWTGKDCCLMLAGDMIYVDATAGMFDPERPRDKYEAPYQVLAHLRQWQALFPPVRMRFVSVDDHEFLDNWEPTAAEPDPRAAECKPGNNKPLYHALLHGKRHFLEFYGGLPDALSDSQLLAKPLWYSDSQGAIRCFVMDTRTERELRGDHSSIDARMIGDAQLNALQQWLLYLHAKDLAARPQEAPIPKFILSGSMLLPRRSRVAESCSPAAAWTSDAWDGYPETMASVLRLIAANEVRNVVFLSGDEHLCCVARATVQHGTAAPVVVHSIHASPLYGPYPFANAKPWRFAAGESFSVSTGGLEKVQVDVSTRFAQVGDCFALVLVRKDSCGYSLNVTFSGQKAEVVEVIALH